MHIQRETRDYAGTSEAGTHTHTRAPVTAPQTRLTLTPWPVMREHTPHVTYPRAAGTPHESQNTVSKSVSHFSLVFGGS